MGLQRRPRALQETHHVNGLRQVLRLWWCKAGAGDQTPGSALLQRPPGGRLCRRHRSIEVLCRAQRSAECSAERSAAAAGALERGDAEAAAGGDLAGEAGRRHGGGEDRCLDLGGGAARVVGGIERRRAADVGSSLACLFACACVLGEGGDEPASWAAASPQTLWPGFDRTQLPFDRGWTEFYN